MSADMILVSEKQRAAYLPGKRLHKGHFYNYYV